MLPLDSDEWEELEHAYGSAEEVPEWLDDLAAGDPEDQAEAMLEIWKSLHHQGDVYSATLAAAPHLVELAKTRHGKARLDLIIFAGLVASNDDQ